MIRPSSMNEAVASLSRGLMPSTRMIVLLEHSGDLGHGRRPEFVAGDQGAEDLLQTTEEAVLIGARPGVGAPARHERRAVEGEADEGRTLPAESSQVREHPLARGILEVQPDST